MFAPSRQSFCEQPALDVLIIDTMFAEAIEVTTGLYNEFRKNVEIIKPIGAPQMNLRWPAELLQKLVKGPQRLWVAELLWCESPNVLSITTKINSDNDAAIQHDLALLGIDTNSSNEIDIDKLRTRFLESRAWNWLMERLKEADGRELYFGCLSAILHDALLDDPKLYRQDVKVLAANLIRWTETFGQSSVALDRPNYSQRLRLTQP